MHNFAQIFYSSCINFFNFAFCTQSVGGGGRSNVSNGFSLTLFSAQFSPRFSEKRKASGQTAAKYGSDDAAPTLFLDVESGPDFAPDNGNGTRRAPDVHLLVLDSVSHTELLRLFSSRA